MTEKERLMQIRERIKKKRPSFRRVESWRHIRVKDSWRKARGIDSKTRRKSKAGVKSPSVGYRGPKKIRGLHPSGFEEIRITNLDELIKLNLNPKKHAIKISTRLGAKKRLELIEYAQKRNFRILNIGISQKEIEELEKLLEQGKEELIEEDEDFDDEDFEENED